MIKLYIHGDVDRKKYIDFAKVIAIILIMISHTNIINQKISIFFTGFYITIFFVCTGITFKDEKLNSYKNLLKTIKKMLLYYFVINLILFSFFLLKSYIGNNISVDFFKNALKGIFYSRYSITTDMNPILFNICNSPMWFITCYCVAYTIFYCINKIIKKDSNRIIAFLVVFFIGYLLSKNNILLPWSIDVAFYMSCFIFVGYYIQKNKILDKINLINTIIIFSIYILTVFDCNIPINYSIKLYGINYFYSTFMALIGSVGILSICKQLENFKITKYISNIGKYTMEIMCIHLFIFRITEKILPIPYKIITIIIQIIIAIIISIFINKTLYFMKHKVIIKK